MRLVYLFLIFFLLFGLGCVSNEYDYSVPPVAKNYSEKVHKPLKENSSFNNTSVRNREKQNDTLLCKPHYLLSSKNFVKNFYVKGNYLIFGNKIVNILSNKSEEFQEANLYYLNGYLVKKEAFYWDIGYFPDENRVALIPAEDYKDIMPIGVFVNNSNYSLFYIHTHFLSKPSLYVSIKDFSRVPLFESPHSTFDIPLFGFIDGTHLYLFVRVFGENYSLYRFDSSSIDFYDCGSEEAHRTCAIFTEKPLPLFYTRSKIVSFSRYQNRIVFSNYSDSNYDVFLFDLNEKKLVPISAGPWNEKNPSVYGDLIVWQDDRNGNYDLYAYNLTSKKSFPLVATKGIESRPVLYNKLLVWVENYTDFYYCYFENENQS